MPALTLIAVVVATVLLAALALLQTLVAAGRPLGRFVWGGQHRVLPTRLRIGSAVSVVLYAAFAALLWSGAGLLPGGDTIFVDVALWVLCGYFVLGTVMNAISRSRAERATMTPACAVLALATLVIALGL
ncbi:hypothetical protein [Microbacterium terricola]|uniref:Integral membrane protein n=1 Tax=Microbacterium terricola TaxID=344163 RepID=A0ABM8E0G7_9MICO|nr:hypothetical protein [Microbacterium terricola]UYK40825.1 hypothetical protein OAU46_04025 [Microbacterium terricola]BDV31427.1 hypothetical protein Microterr_20870 [Microbacterium terricola]